MPTRNLQRAMALVFAALSVFALVSCGAGSNPTQAPRDTADAFSLSVLPESFEPGGHAEIDYTVRRDGDLTHVEVVARDAEGLKALYFDLAYDREQFHPLSAEPTDAFGRRSEILHVAVLDAPAVHFGVVQRRFAEREGFRGTAPIARISFRRGPAEPSRGASATTTSDRSRTTLEVDLGTDTLSWLYYNNGDYDQNSEVNGADLTPIAANFLAAGGPFPATSILSVVDGDGNGEINGADIVPIAGSFRNTVASYNVYASATPAPYPATNSAPSTITPVANVPFSAAVGVRSAERLRFSLSAPELTYDPSLYYWVRPVHLTQEGTPSTLLNPQAVGNPPVITSLGAVPDTILAGETSTVTVVATDPEGGPLTYTWSASPGTISGFGPSVTYNAPATVAVQTQATITVTVRDEDLNETEDSTIVTVNPIPTFTVHIDFTPAALSGVGTEDDPFILDEATTYTFTALDGDGADITADVTFEAFTDDPLDPPFAVGTFTGNELTVTQADNPFIAPFHVIGTYMQGTPEETSSDPDLAGEEMHFDRDASLPAGL